MTFSLELTVIYVINEGCPTEVQITTSPSPSVITNTPSYSPSPSPSSSPSPSPSPSPSARSFYESISIFIKNKITTECGYLDTQLLGEGTYLTVTESGYESGREITFSFADILVQSNPQPILRRYLFFLFRVIC